MKELLLGAGNSRLKKVVLPGTPTEFTNLTTLDIDKATNPDVWYDLDGLCRMRRNPPYHANRLPFDDDTFDEIHAYEVLEHIGTQGVIETFFWPFAELYRILKPRGLLCGTCPDAKSRWAWGDPGHRRIIGPEQLVFLDQLEYQAQVGVTPMTDYRSIWKGDFERLAQRMVEESYLFILRAHKPARA